MSSAQFSVSKSLQKNESYWGKKKKRKIENYNFKS